MGYEPFLSVAALWIKNRSPDAVSQEVETAFKLFTRGGGGPITVEHLRMVARQMKEDVPDDLLRDMVQEANGGAGAGKGVRLEEFQDVMKRAGVFR